MSFTERKCSTNPFKESELESKPEAVTKVTATILPAPKEALERRMVRLEHQVLELAKLVRQYLLGARAKKPAKNKEGVALGTILQGESQGRKYTLEVVEDGYLCSDGKIYNTLSGAALGVSGNRRSGWRFWKDIEGRSIGEITGRFNSDGNLRPCGT